MRKLIILRGNSGSGKTTIAKQLQLIIGRNTMMISQDTIRRDMLKVKDGANSKAIPLMMELLKYGFNNSEVVILEGILRAAWYDPLFSLALQLYKTNIYSYYFDISFEETLKRHSTREERNRFGINEMQGWWVEKDYSSLLSEKTIIEEYSVEDSINMILSDISLP